MQKKRKEWMQSWCDDTCENDLPRVLLIGDSITRGYESKVRARLQGVCYVDYVATSYAVDSPIYTKLMKAFVDDSRYALVHFNHGLHGIHMTKRTYKSGIKKLLLKIGKDKKLILATTTVVYHGRSKRKHGAWMKRVRERNDTIKELASDLNLAVDDLYIVSQGIPAEKRAIDGTHYMDDGYEILADAVAESIKNLLKE